MQLYDAQLGFARTLIEHWCSIRRGLDPLPREADLDPRQLQPVIPSISIMDVSDPEESIVAVMGRDIRVRYPTKLTHRDWYEFIPEEAAAFAKFAVRKLMDTPCGVYYRYEIRDGCDAVETGEALVLPLLTHKSDKASAWISLARIGGEGGLIIPPVRLEHLTRDFVDIGAGVPA